MSTTQIDRPATPTPFDCATRFTIPSASVAHEVYLVELDSYAGNGECNCMWFETQFRPLLSRGITPDKALASGAIRIKPQCREQDVLRCKHIIEARHQFCTMVIQAMNRAKQTPQWHDHPQE